MQPVKVGQWSKQAGVDIYCSIMDMNISWLFACNGH